MRFNWDSNGGVTNVFGGDTVGVLISGTAVRANKIHSETSEG